MAEENNAGASGGTTTTDVASDAPAKKQRAPRRQKVAVDAVKTAPVKRRKRRTPAESSAAQPAENGATVSTSEKASPARGRGKAAKQVEQTATARDNGMDDMADLIQLEEENKRLRKALAGKLRQENADLRKRLNLD